MKLVSVNTGRAEPIATKSGETGIFKHPRSEAVAVGRLGVAGDTICDTENHGGVDQAVYVYGTPDYAWWSRELGRDLVPGTFGENLTVDGLASADICVGDRLTVGDVVLEVTGPRIPCVTLAARMDDTLFVKRFLQAERPGVYCRAITEGTVAAGDPVALTPFPGERVAVLELNRLFSNLDTLDEATTRRWLAAPVHHKLRDRLEARWG
ncbi:MOSC domain-containing protein [Bauldia sp.]|uniref:MOSC domain-containing protein n=1 Tax=Bauldia sp. TaxID=2575872 RepID=UPI003BAC24D3